jgi:hypothetical protein
MVSFLRPLRTAYSNQNACALPTARTAPRFCAGVFAPKLQASSDTHQKLGEPGLPACFQKRLFRLLSEYINGSLTERLRKSLAMAKTSQSSTVLYFSANWTETQLGTIRRGAPLRIKYDQRRLPAIRDTFFDLPAWSIVAHCKFTGQGEESSVHLRAESDEETMGADINVPAQAEFVELWFTNVDDYIIDQGYLKTYRCHWDSHYGANYLFRIPGADIRQVKAKASEPNFVVSTVADVENVAVAVSELDHDGPAYSLFVHLDSTGGSNGFINWTGHSIIGYKSRFGLTVLYGCKGRRYRDDNDGLLYVFDRLE